MRLAAVALSTWPGHHAKEPFMTFPWKTTIAVSALLAATVYAFAQMSPGMGPMGMQGRMQHGGMHDGMTHGMHGQRPAAMPSLPGQDAFGAIQEVVQILEADPATDWSKVNIEALREHLIDMNEVTLNATAVPRMLDNGIEIAVTGSGRTLAAIKRMVPAHVHELHALGWDARAEALPDGVKLTVAAANAKQLAKLKALGFIGIMVQGGHHQPHHLMIAKGELLHQ
jgi:hypothetical protein